MQRVYYHDYSLYHSVSSLKTTFNKTPIPIGAYFSEVDCRRTSILKTLDVSWSYDFARIPKPSGKSAFLDNAIPIFSIGSEYMPTALFYENYLSCKELDKVIQYYENKISLPRPSLRSDDYCKLRYDRIIFEQLYQAAEFEYLTVSYKFEFSLWCGFSNLDDVAKSYLKRAEDHAKKLKSLEVHCQISQSHFNLFKEYQKQKPHIFSKEREDFWKPYTQP